MSNLQTGSYLLSARLAPTGSNRVDFTINGDQISINHAPFRPATSSELKFLKGKLASNQS